MSRRPSTVPPATYEDLRKAEPWRRRRAPSSWSCWPSGAASPRPRKP